MPLPLREGGQGVSTLLKTTPRREGRRVGVGESERTQTRAPPQQCHQVRLLPPPQARRSVDAPDTAWQSPVQQGTVVGRSRQVTATGLDPEAVWNEPIVRCLKKSGVIRLPRILCLHSRLRIIITGARAGQFFQQDFSARI
eukprot:COSAG01_NODE_2741_length_7157_cov_10.590677_6_plen_141_part_00